MNVKECYDMMGADYAGTFGRLLKDERIKKYLDKFAAIDNYGSIKNELDAGNIEAAFRAAHSLKGVAANLGLTKVFEAAHPLCEELRPLVMPDHDISGLLEAVKSGCDEAYALISQIGL